MSTTIQPASICTEVSLPSRSSLLLYTQRERGLSYPQLAFQLVLLTLKVTPGIILRQQEGWSRTSFAADVDELSPLYSPHPHSAPGREGGCSGDLQSPAL